ncbi:SH3 domain-containing protein [Polaromonas naphthalenivorans]|uniref:SH3b domain-containing protein n=1 Tax=Polaromonas naphthalenivorans (strain CJ2) TaxID=365044 RepID=A1VV74_POLNA|nr:SH3 domain-containing protein [Polaromonas naphthalenivorans]ABM39552.1 hypothetical protein Pnap_4269 [Polaromonas naphthalenivorans CJ2]
MTAPEKNKTGFAGLSSLESNVDVTEKNPPSPSALSASPTQPDRTNTSTKAASGASAPSSPSTLASIPATQSVRPQAQKTSSSPPPVTYVGSSKVFIVGALTVCVIIVSIIASKSNDATRPAENDANSASTYVEVSVPPKATVPKITFAVASLSANVREKPTARSRQLRVLKQGEILEFIEVTGSFTRVKLLDSTLGFIASELLIPEDDFQRLKNLSARQYVDQRSDEKRLDSVQAQIKPMDDAVSEAISAISSRSPSIKASLQTIDEGRHVGIASDEAAGIWYSLAARAAANSAQFEDAVLNARAAVEAAPLNPDYYVAMGLSSYKIGYLNGLNMGATMLPILAPKSTNAWMIFGLSVATLDNEIKYDTFAIGAFVLAIKLSKNPDVTRKYFLEMSNKSDNIHLKKLLNEALDEESKNPSVFGF